MSGRKMASHDELFREHPQSRWGVKISFLITIPSFGVLLSPVAGRSDARFFF